MLVISKRLYYSIICLIVCFICLFVYLNQNKIPVYAKKFTNTIVVDAGHGYPDGGAVGINATIESTLNIKVSKLLKKKLEKKGYSVIMTRNDEDSVSSEGKTMAKQKTNDMYKRLEIINTSNADMAVSVHMNQFTDSRYHGAQVLYSSNFGESENLGRSIQKSLCEVPENKSKRESLCAPNTLYLMKKAQIPAVIVECGFLSNFAEEQRLNTYEYQNALADAICEGIVNYYKKSP